MFSSIHWLLTCSLNLESFASITEDKVLQVTGHMQKYPKRPHGKFGTHFLRVEMLFIQTNTEMQEHRDALPYTTPVQALGMGTACFCTSGSTMLEGSCCISAKELFAQSPHLLKAYLRPWLSPKEKAIRKFSNYLLWLVIAKANPSSRHIWAYLQRELQVSFCWSLSSSIGLLDGFDFVICRRQECFKGTCCDSVPFLFFIFPISVCTQKSRCLEKPVNPLKSIIGFGTETAC